MIKQRPLTMALCGLLWGLLGFLGNWFRFELFFNVDYLIGSVFVMLAILMVGGAPGVLAGFMAATCSYVLWHHPWAIIIMTGEALFVAVLYARRRGNIVIYDTFYWLILGIPQIYLFYHLVMAIPLQSTLLIMFKQSINGIMNSLVALTLYILIKQWKISRKERLPYSQLIFAVMATLALIPAMLLLMAGMRMYQAEEEDALAARLSYTAEAARSSLAGWIKEHHLIIQTLADLVGNPKTSRFSEMQHYIDTLKAATPAFSRMGVMNQDSISVAYAPLEIDGKSTLGVDFADRPYIGLMKEKKRPYIPDVIMGKLGVPIPIALLLAPIVVGGQYRGYAAGVIDLKELLAVFTHIQIRSHSNVTLVDGNWRVIASTLPDQHIMSPFQRPYVSQQALPLHEVFHWIPAPEPGTSIMQRWRRSLLVKALPLSPDYGWKVVVEEPILPIVERLSRFSIYSLGLFGLLTLLTVAILQLFSKAIVSTVVTLQDITRFLPQRLDQAEDIAWPESKISELHGLINNFEEMTDSLQERETALRESQRQQAFLAELVENSSQPFATRGLDGSLGFFNAAFHQMLGYTREELQALQFIPRSTAPDWHDREEAELQEILRTGQPRRYEKEYLRKDGSRLPVELFVHLRLDEQGQPLFYGFITDISERRQAEEALRRAHDELEERVAERTRDLHRTVAQFQEEVAERRQAEKALRESEQTLRYLASRILTAQEQERKRIAMELHEGLAQSMAALKMQLHTTCQHLPTVEAAVQEDFAVANHLIVDIIEEVRRISRGLSPVILENLGLSGAIKYLLDDLGKHQNLSISEDIADLQQLFATLTEINLFRVIQEAFHNIAKHARATQVTVAIKKQAGRVDFLIQDNGIGLPPQHTAPQDRAEAGMGLASMAERLHIIGSRLNLTSQPGRGTTISFSVTPDFS